MMFFWGGLIGLVNGFFASGGGIVAVMILEKIMKIETKRAHATAIAIILPLSLLSVIVYGVKGFVDWKLILETSAGGTVGAVTGAKLLEKLPKRYIKMGFGLVMIAAGWRMLA